MIDARALTAQRLRAALADVAVAADDRDLAGDHHVGGAVDAVDQRVPAAVEVVELRLRDRVVHVDRREQQRAGFVHLVEPVHTGRRLLGDALDARRRPRATASGCSPSKRPSTPRITAYSSLSAVDGSGTLPAFSNSTPLWISSVASPPSSRSMFGPCDRLVGVGPAQRLLGAPPVLLERLALPREHRERPRVLGRAGAADRDRGRGVVLGREDVAARPAHLARRGRRASR